jgi:hypothetical protein
VFIATQQVVVSAALNFGSFDQLAPVPFRGTCRPRWRDGPV